MDREIESFKYDNGKGREGAERIQFEPAHALHPTRLIFTTRRHRFSMLCLDPYLLKGLIGSGKSAMPP